MDKTFAAEHGGEVGAFTPQKTITIDVLPPHPKGAPVPEPRQREVAADHFHPMPRDLSFFALIGRGAANETMRALETVSSQVAERGREPLIFNRPTHSILGHRIPPGSFGLMDDGGQPRLVPQTGLVWNYFAPTRHFHGCSPRDHVNWRGIQVRTISQNEAAVLSHPSGDTFVVQEAAGFVSFDLEGPYTHLMTVQRNHTQNPHVDPYSKEVLGYRLVVHNRHQSSAAEFLNVPANHVAVLQRGHALEMLPGGLHTLTDPGVSFRNFFSMGDVNISTKPISVMTADQVSASIVLNVNFCLREPLLLAGHGFLSPWEPVRDPVQTTLGSVVASLEYKHFLGQGSLAEQATTREPGPSGTRSFNEAVQAECLFSLREMAHKYGIDIHHVRVLSRQFEGNTHEAMEELSKQAMTANQQRRIVDIQNENAERTQKGRQLVLDIENAQLEKRSRAEAEAAVARARGESEAAVLAAQGAADALAIRTAAEARARQVLAEVDASIDSEHARRMQVLANQVEQLRALGDRAVVVPVDLAGTASQHAAGYLAMRATDAKGGPR